MDILLAGAGGCSVSVLFGEGATGWVVVERECLTALRGSRAQLGEGGGEKNYRQMK